MLKRNVFIDKNLQSIFDEVGYVKIPFLDENEVDELLNFYYTHQSGLKGGYHSSMFSSSYEYRLDTHQKIKSVIQQKVTSVLDDHKIEICTFLVKDPDHMSRVGLHCDWSLTDESQFQSIILWISLVDVDENNGAMYMLDGSHRDTNSIRGEGIDVPYDQLSDEFVIDNMTLVPARKGEAIIFDLSVLHCSFPNKTSEPRIAFNVGLIPGEAPSLHYYVDSTTSKGMYDIYDAKNDFYLKNKIGTRPTKDLYIGSKPFIFDGLSPEELVKKYSNVHI